MSSPCLSGAGRTYGFDLEIVKSPTTYTRTSLSSSPCSTLSESSNSASTISTRKSRTPRKRPNQTYNEAAALLSTAYPNIFSRKHLTKNPCKFTKPRSTLLLDEPPDLLLPFRVFDNSGFLLSQQPIRERPSFLHEAKVDNSMMSCADKSGGEVDSDGNNSTFKSLYRHEEEEEEDFDAESLLDEEIEEGIDSIMGNLNVENETAGEVGSSSQLNSWYGGFHFGGTGIGTGMGVRALRHHVDEGNWWHFPIVDMLQISPRLGNNNNKKSADGNSNKPASRSKPGEKKKKKVEKPPAVESKTTSETVTEEDSIKENSIPQSSPSRLLLKLNYDDVLSAWSDRSSPFPDGTPASEGNDVSVRLAQIDLFSENDGVREASVLRYKEKRRTRLFSKKIRYQVRKVNADQRPRMKGRFVRRPNTSSQEEKNKKGFKS